MLFNVNSNFKNKLRNLLFLLLILLAFIFGVIYDKVNSLGSAVSVVKTAKAQEITSANLKNLLDGNEDFFLINVHTPYEGEILKTDSFIAYDELVANQGILPEDKKAKIIVYCKTGNMSSQAVQTLVGLGYKNVSHLKGGTDAWQNKGYELLDLSKISQEVLPEEGSELPISWGDMGPRLIDAGVINKSEFEKIVQMSDEEKEILSKGSTKKIRINSQNSQFVVDMLWAFGLGQKSKVYEEGPMGKEYKSQAGNFSSTGGWTLASGNTMDHYNRHNFISLTDEQEKRVIDISKNVYRPCCGNNTFFPDCNHGMAALAAIELMIAQGLPDDEIYKNILKLNSYWFGNTYLTTATYFARQGISWNKVDAKEALSYKFSSSTGAAEIAKIVGEVPAASSSGGGCGA